jgi:hypothetical protein
MFALTSDGFNAYEYLDGSMPDLSSTSKEFFTDFIDYLVTMASRIYSASRFLLMA